jgi:hypothetical protein
MPIRPMLHRASLQIAWGLREDPSVSGRSLIRHGYPSALRANADAV